jgi:S1-C subfamily serine protease
MRSRVVAAVAVAAAAGGVLALVLGSATGLGGDGGSKTVYVSVPVAGAGGTTGRTTPPELGNGFDPAAIYARRAPGVVTIYAELEGDDGSQGSGFVVDAEGTILTNAHVITNVARSDVAGPDAVRGADRVFVEFKDGERVPASIVGWDLFADVGVVSVNPKAHRLAPLPLGDSAEVVVGTPVAAIGSPFGNQSSLAVGVVSATGRSIPSLTSEYAVADAIQVDAPINRGNSGGPLLDPRGSVIGINAQIRSSSGTAEGVGFAIPINVARRSLQQLVATGRVAYAYIGIKTQDVTPGLARRFRLGAARGALVAEVEPGTPAARAGLRGGGRTADYNGLDVTVGGDLIVRIGPRPVRSSEDVSRIVSDELLPGQRVAFTIIRDGTRRTVRVLLVERPRGTSG